MFTFIGTRDKTQCVYSPDAPRAAGGNGEYYLFGKRVTMDPHEDMQMKPPRAALHWEAMWLNPAECPDRLVR